VKPWRETVMWACREQARDQHIAGAVKVEMIFTLYKPVEARKRKRTRPSTPPDLSKLARSTEDALTLARVWEDDARVVEYLRLAKVYPNEDPDALSVPGAVIRIHRLTAVEPEQPVLEFAVRKGAQPELQLSGNR
jgi:Holliday junction resolvase RusA-like endonuclease